jgi:hypothetical protein
MPRTPTTRRRRPFARARTALALLAVLTVAAAMACGGHDDEETGTDPTAAETTTTPPTTAELTPEEEAKAVYLEFVNVVDRLVTESPNPNDPELARLAIDPVLGTVHDSVATLQAENQLWQQGDRNSHSTTSPVIGSNGLATLGDCLVEDDVLVDLDDGSVVRTQPLATRTLEVTLTPQGDSWAVAAIDEVAVVDGEVPCEH